MQEKRHDRVVEMRLCFFLGKVGDYNVSFVETRMCRSTLPAHLQNYIDYAAYGRDMELEGTFVVTNHGVYEIIR